MFDKIDDILESMTDNWRLRSSFSSALDTSSGLDAKCHQFPRLMFRIKEEGEMLNDGGLRFGGRLSADTQDELKDGSELQTNQEVTCLLEYGLNFGS